MSNDTIYRQQVFDAFNTSAKELVVCGIQNAIMVEYYLNRILETIKGLPPAEPEIIHCRDCKWYELPSHKITENCVRWMKSNGILLPIKPNDFCSRAERREDGTD